VYLHCNGRKVFRYRDTGGEVAGKREAASNGYSSDVPLYIYIHGAPPPFLQSLAYKCDS